MTGTLRDLWKRKAELHRSRAAEMRAEAQKLNNLAVAEEELAELADQQYDPERRSGNDRRVKWSPRIKQSERRAMFESGRPFDRRKQAHKTVAE
jgi:hypothetical protein